MEKITKEEDVVNWARKTVDSKGDKFTALSKGDQFVIAKYVIGLKEGQEEPVDKEKTEGVTKIQTRAERFLGQGLDSQQVFDKYLAWAAEHPREVTVMDFSNGKTFEHVAFAYWLFSKEE